MAVHRRAWPRHVMSACAVFGMAVFVAGGPARAADALALETGVTPHAKIDLLYSRLSKAVASLDTRTFASIYAADAYYLPPDSPLVTGLKGVQAHGWDGWFAWMKEGKGTLAMDFRIVAREVYDAIGYDVGYYKILQARPGEADVTLEGKLVVVTKRQADGEWRFQVDAFNNLKKSE